MFKKLFFVIVFLLLSFLFPLQTVHAAFWDDIIGGVKKLLPQSSQPTNLTVDSSIILAPGGDVDKNSQINEGDIVRFQFTINNSTNQKYTFATLNTNIDRKSINFIHNLYGVTGMRDDGRTISFRNLRINPGEALEISFDARLNYFKESERAFSSTPELLTSDKKSLKKSAKKEIKAKSTLRKDAEEEMSNVRRNE